MKGRIILAMILTLGVVLITSSAALAGPYSYQVGDADGFGFGASNSGIAVWDGPGAFGIGMDHRDAAEQAATNGAQITDVYSAMDPINGPNTFTSASVIIPIPAGMMLINATFTVAMGGFQSTQLYPFNVNFNGVTENFSFQDGFQVTTIRDFVLTSAEIAAANLAGEFVCNFDRDTSIDAIAFDYFQLSGDVQPVPLPGAALLLGSGLFCLAAYGRRKSASKS